MTQTPDDDQGRASEPAGEASQPAGGQDQPGYWERQAHEQQAQEQQGYAQQPYQQPYQQPGYAPQAPMYTQDHPRATTVLVLGILGLVLCQVLGPFAWVMGKKTVEEIDASGGTLGGRGAANAGYILGIVATILLGLGVLTLVVGLVVLGAVSTSTGIR